TQQPREDVERALPAARLLDDHRHEVADVAHAAILQRGDDTTAGRARIVLSGLNASTAASCGARCMIVSREPPSAGLISKLIRLSPSRVGQTRSRRDGGSASATRA